MKQQYIDSSSTQYAREGLRILLVSAQEQTRDELTDALQQLGVMHRLFWVSQPEIALTRAQDILPALIFVEDDLNRGAVSRLVEQLITAIPTAPVLVIVDAQNTSVARTAVLAGARGFLLKPLRTDELGMTLQHVLNKHSITVDIDDEERAEGKIIVFCAPKGGTGRTTLALNTSIGLHQLTKESVVLVDADFAAPALDVALNLQREQDITALLPRLSQLDEDIISSVLAHHVSGINVLLAPPPEVLTAPISLPQVQVVLARLKRMFSWIIIDLGLPMNETAFAFLDSADRIVMNVLPEMVGLRNTRLMLDQLLGRGYASERIWLVLNRANIKGGVSSKDIETRLQVKITEKIPDDQALVTYSVNRGIPLVLSHDKSPLANAFFRFSSRIASDMGRDTPEVDESGKLGAFRRLLMNRNRSGR